MSRFTFPKNFRVEKGFNTANVDELLSLTFSETDIDRMLTRIAERMVKGGRVAKASKLKFGDKTAEEMTVSDYARLLQNSHDVVGFSGNSGAEALEGWLRSSVLIVKGRGKSRVGEGIDYIAPITAAAYRTGFPKNAQRHRRADKLIFDLMMLFLEALEVEAPHQVLRHYCASTVGQGVDFGSLPHKEPKYDGEAPLDLSQLLAIRFIELFENTAADVSADDEFTGTAFPGLVAPIARDLVALFQVMAGETGKAARWDVSDAYSALRSIIAIRLFQIPLRMQQALRSALDGNPNADGWKGAQQEESEELLKDEWTNPLELYCDFTDVANSPSERLARDCVGRDLDSLRLLFHDRMLVRAMIQAGSQTTKRDLLTGNTTSPPERRALLAEVVRAQEDPDYKTAASWYLNNIEAHLKNEDGEAADEQSLRALQDARAQYENPLHALAAVIAASRERDGLEGLIKWTKATGGLQSAGLPKGYALLRGREGQRSTWKYRPAEELTLNLIDLCFVDPPNSSQKSVATQRNKMTLKMLLHRLRVRYGILIDRPPADFDSPENRQAAAENLRAFTRSLRDMGCFETLSDDFEGQFVRKPRRNS